MALRNLFTKKSVGKKEQKVDDVPTGGSVPVQEKSGYAEYGVLRAPVISEKASLLGERGTYVFFVRQGANKITIKKAVSMRFGVDVVSVRIGKKPQKRIRRGAHIGYRHGYKKALVSVLAGQKIELA